MNRKDFLKGLGFLGLSATGISVLNACSGDERDSLLAEDTSGTETDTPATGGTETPQNTETCEVTTSETAGPFPTKNPQTLEQIDITDNRTGVSLDINLTVQNVNADCVALEGAMVDIWHCDKDGYYSEYGNTSLQPEDFTSDHFLRGRQVSNSDGKVNFKSIFPGWYNGRATHIHVHIYNQNGNSLLVTQIAFPEGDNSAVAQVNSASDAGYTKGMTGYTFNASDNVFKDGTTNEMSAITGNIADGFVLSHTLKVNA